MANPLLKVSDLNVFYGDAQALWNVDFQVQEAEICSIIGSNGAGKSTTLKTIAGLSSPASGEIAFLGTRVDGKETNKILDLGIALVPEGRGLFATLTVLENLELGAFTKRARHHKKETLEWINHLFPIIRDRKYQLAGKMSGGEQQMVAIGRGLMSKPRLLMLDEPSLGLAPIVLKTIFDIIRTLNRDGVTQLLVEQNVHQALKIAHHALVLKTGKVILSGSGEEILGNPEVQKAYVGRLE